SLVIPYNPENTLRSDTSILIGQGQLCISRFFNPLTHAYAISSLILSMVPSSVICHPNSLIFTLPSNRCVKCIVLDNIEIDIFGQMFKYKEHGGMEQNELVQNRVVGPNSSFRETKNNKRETLKYEAINDWANMIQNEQYGRMADMAGKKADEF
ncbi:MAG: hypothetical protein EZS28_056432, partial [Streblomastix strix]